MYDSGAKQLGRFIYQLKIDKKGFWIVDRKHIRNDVFLGAFKQTNKDGDELYTIVLFCFSFTFGIIKYGV